MMYMHVKLKQDSDMHHWVTSLGGMLGFGIVTAHTTNKCLVV